MKKILIANRGEIAVRIIRTCRDMGLASVAVYSACDRTSLHVRLADEARAIGPDEASQSYLRIDNLIEAAEASGADAVHPGYGFLAENVAFAEACRNAGLIFIGPPSAAMSVMASKTAARQVAARAGVPVVPGTDHALGSGQSDAETVSAAAAVGYPLLVKAVAGGGGKGMRVVRAPADLPGAVRMARSEGRSAFGDPAVYFERLLDRPRHIEIQLLGDAHGKVIAFVERECSIQRRHQKLVEESPSPSVDPALRAALMAAAVRIGEAVGYTGAGTVEFLVDAGGRYHFLEMNTRLQVEHPVTEAITGIDFVRAQIEIARGVHIEDVAGAGPRSIASPEWGGHAIECRIYAEDPRQGFLPSPGRITHLRAPAGPGIRDDSGAYAGWVVPASYDPLISKVVAWGPDRQGALARMVRALKEYDLRGIRTTVGFCRRLLETRAFQAGDFDTTTVDRLVADPGFFEDGSDSAEQEVAVAAAVYAHARTARPDPHITPTRSDSLWARQARLDNLR